MLRPRCSTFALSCLCWTGALALIACPSAREDKQEQQRPKTPSPPRAAAPAGALDDHHQPDELTRAFESTPHFAPLPTAKPGDWLAEHDESGQTFAQYQSSEPNIPGPPRDTIYLLPIGSFEGESSPPLGVLEDYTRAFFGLAVQRLPAVEVAELGVETREHGGHRQLHAGTVLEVLPPRLPDDAYCLIGLTMEDLYPEDSWNYVFGYASLRTRVGIYSFARYDPAFFDEPRPADVDALILRRSMQVMSHELGHMFGMQHCVHYSCNMNGSNSLEEADTQPSHLCPVCLRKLHASTGGDPLARYRALGEFYAAHELGAEAKWIEARVAHVVGEAAAAP